MPDVEMDRVPENGTESDISQDSLDKTSGSKKLLDKKKTKRGIVFLSTIPPYMNVAKVREIFSQFGEVGRIYLQPTGSKYFEVMFGIWQTFLFTTVRYLSLSLLPEPGEKRKRVPNQFTEGWVEFKKKKLAKEVAAKLNNTKIGSRKKSRYYDMIWNIKYIPRFKWVHLSERLAYERAAMKQRLRAEISQAKKEAHYLQTNVEKSKKIKRRKLIENIE